MKKYSITLLLFLATAALTTTAQNMHFSACQGKLTRLDSLMGDDTDINIVDKRGRSLLHFAVGCEQAEVFKFLMAQGIDTKIRDNRGATPLSIAIRNNSDLFIIPLLELHTNSELKGTYGTSLLEKAIFSKNLSVVKKLIDKEVALNLPNERGSTPLEIANRINAREISTLLISKGADQSMVRTYKMEGLYMGQLEPGLTPKMFAPNFVSTEEYEFGSVFSKDGREFYYGVNANGKEEIRYSRLTDNLWSTPVTILAHEKYGYNDPFLSPDENRLYFISQRAMDGLGESKDYDIWYVEKALEGWSEPINAGSKINSDRDEYYISFTNDGTMYFASDKGNPNQAEEPNHDIYYSKFINGAFQEAVALGDSVNTQAYEADVFVDPEESYLIFCATRPDGLGRGDLYISFKNDDGTWTESVNMGETINSENHELCPFVTSDGKYLFYTSDQDIYWISTDILERYRSK